MNICLILCTMFVDIETSLQETTLGKERHFYSNNGIKSLRFPRHDMHSWSAIMWNKQELIPFVYNCTPIDHSLYPFKSQYQHVYSHHCSTYVSYLTDWENLLKNPDISSLVIISFILINCAFDQAVILLGEIRCHCWDLKGYSLRCADMYIYHGIVSC